MEKPRKEIEDLSKIISRRRNQVIQREETWALIRRIIFLMVVVWVMFTQVFQFVRVRGMEMFPALKDGDLALVFRMHQGYEKGDVIAYRYGDEVKIGRLIAAETDMVNIEENGNLLVNGTTQTGEIMYPTYAKEGNTYPKRISEGHVFVLGDYRTQCTDSRDFGEIPEMDVVGKVITILRRRGL